MGGPTPSKEVTDSVGVLAISVLCLSAADSSVLAPTSKAPGLPAFVVWTKRSDYPLIEPTLRAVQKAQGEHFARTGAYSADVASLKLAALPERVKLTVDATATNWSATVVIDRRLPPTCRIDGSAAPDPSGVPRGRVDCQDW
jgi:hypothetical protein